MRISDWSSDVCSSDLAKGCRERPGGLRRRFAVFHARRGRGAFVAAGRHARAGVQREGLLIRVETLKPLSCEAGEGLKQMASGRAVTLKLVQFMLLVLDHPLYQVAARPPAQPRLAVDHSTGGGAATGRGPHTPC